MHSIMARSIWYRLQMRQNIFARAKTNLIKRRIDRWKTGGGWSRATRYWSRSRLMGCLSSRLNSAALAVRPGRRPACRCPAVTPAASKACNIGANKAVNCLSEGSPADAAADADQRRFVQSSKVATRSSQVVIASWLSRHLIYVQIDVCARCFDKKKRSSPTKEEEPQDASSMESYNSSILYRTPCFVFR